MLALGIETESEETRKDMLKRLDGEKIRIALANMRAAGIRSFGFFILGYPGDDTARRSNARSTTPSISIRTSPTSTRPCPIRAPSSTPKPSATACSPARTGRAWSIRTTCWSGNGLDEPTVMAAINRAKRRFYLRPSYLVRHAGDIVRLATSKWGVLWHVASRVLFGAPVHRRGLAAARRPASRVDRLAHQRSGGVSPCASASPSCSA